MKNLIPSIQTKLKSIPELKYVDEDWGQLDYYSPNFPVKWPCILIDIAQAGFSNVGQDKNVVPMQRQLAEATISLTIAELKLTNTSGLAPQMQKDQARSIWGLIDKVHIALQGFNATIKTSKLIRTGLQRVKRDDGVQQYVVMYSCSLTNV